MHLPKRFSWKEQNRLSAGGSGHQESRANDYIWAYLLPQEPYSLYPYDFFSIRKVKKTSRGVSPDGPAPGPSCLFWAVPSRVWEWKM